VKVKQSKYVLMGSEMILCFLVTSIWHFLLTERGREATGKGGARFHITFWHSDAML